MKRKVLLNKEGTEKAMGCKREGKRVFYGAEIQGRVMRTMDLRGWVGARTETTLLEM